MSFPIAFSEANSEAGLISSAALCLTDVSVRYLVPTEHIQTLKEHLIRRLQGKHSYTREFWALRNLNLEVQKGEVLGVVGRNGAGKSTLLKVIARVLPPTSGRVVVRGQVAPLIELGAGFHMELTGRENIFLYGTMLGFSQSEMEKKLDSIVAFSDLGSFIDLPLRTYSSGMVVRLGFSVAAEVDPDILIIDEVLSVGDLDFQEKCLARMEDFRKRKTTILFVSHSVDTVREFCTRVAWIDEGRIVMEGDVVETTDAYVKSVHESE